MHSIFILGNNLLPDSALEDRFAEKGLELKRFSSIHQSLKHLDKASVIIIDNKQSSHDLFKDFLKKTGHIPKIVISKDSPPKGIHRWLTNNITYPAVKPSRSELFFLVNKALHDSELYNNFSAMQENLENAENELAFLEEISKTLTSSIDMHSIIDFIMKHIVDITRAKGWSLYLMDEDSNKLFVEKTHKKKTRKQKKTFLELGEGIAGWVAQEGIPVIIPDINSDKRFRSQIGKGVITGKKSIICVPLKSKGRILGALEIVDKNKGIPFTKDDLEVILKLVDHAALAIERASLYQKMAELAITDDLTKLFNSRYLNRTIETEISRCDRYNASVSLIFMDVDHFKHINDNYGHLIGSKVLVEMGQLLIKGLRSIDIVSRYGGDEFVIVLPQTPPSVSSKIAERLRRNINKHTFLRSEGLNLKITASFGVASYPESAHTKDELLRLADEAMYTVKNKTRDGVYTISL